MVVTVVMVAVSMVAAAAVPTTMVAVLAVIPIVAAVTAVNFFVAADTWAFLGSGFQTTFSFHDPWPPIEWYIWLYDTLPLNNGQYALTIL